MGDDNLESPLRSYDFNSQTNGYREFFPPDYSWPPVGNDVRAHSTGPEPAATGRFVPVAPRTSWGRDGWRSTPPTMEWRPGTDAGQAPVNLPDAPRGPAESLVPLDERFDEPTSGFTGFDRLNSFGSRITENSSDAIIRRFVQAKKSNPNIKLIKRGGGIDQLSGRQIPEQYFIQPQPELDPYIATDIPPRGRMTVVPQSSILDANPRMTVVPQQEILDANPEMLPTYDPPVRRMEVIRQSDILGVPRGYSPTWDTPGRRLPGTFSPY